MIRIGPAMVQIARILAILGLVAANPAHAATCAEARPGWDGTPVSAWQEVMFLVSTAPVLILLVLTAIALRLRSPILSLIVTVLWTGMVTLVAMVDPGGLRADLAEQGCGGSPTLFIALATAICVGMILYIVRPQGGPE